MSNALPVWGLAAILAAAGGAALLNPISSSSRGEVVRRAAGELGKTDAEPYVEDATGAEQTGSLEWCGLFALWALHQAGLALDWLWSFDPEKPGFFYRLPHVSAANVQPGDMVYFHRPYQHHAIVESVNRKLGMVSTLNGNGAGGAVTRVVRPLSDATTYYSIAPLLPGGAG